MEANESEPVEEANPMLAKSTWEEFRKSGLLWFVNRMLHLFGWAIVVEVEHKEGPAISAYPARTKFRGFDGGIEDSGFHVLTRYLDKEMPTLLRDTELVPKGDENDTKN